LSRLPPFKIGWRRREKKSEPRVESEYLDWALADFSGYVAADELYDGPFCVLSVVDNRHCRRLLYEVLEHSPTHDDLRRFLGRLKAVLDARGLKLRGITTDASPLYPVPLAELFGDVPHQICQFHIIAELTKAVLKAVTKVRKEILARRPKLPRGRPKKGDARRQVQIKKRLQQRATELFDGRYLFVQRELTAIERKKLKQISRGQPQLRTLREIMEEVYRLFDRRCRTATALKKLGRLRSRVRRFQKVGLALKKIFSPALDKALTFLDDRCLPATSNAVERGNRRHRKMQKSVYRVRTCTILKGRMALDLLREAQLPDGRRTLQLLHEARLKCG